MYDLKYRLNPTDFDDWTGLYQLLAKNFAYMEGLIDPPSSFTKLTPQLLAKKSDSENLLVVECDGNLVACAFFKPENEALYVGKIAVEPQFRRQGLTRKILQQAENFAKQKAIKWLELQVRIELADNKLTFERLGFIKTGEDSHAGYSRITSITMRRAVL